MSNTDEFNLKALSKEASKDMKNLSLYTIPASAEKATSQFSVAHSLTLFTLSIFLIGHKGAPVFERLKWVTPNALWGRSYLAISAYAVSTLLGLRTLGAWSDAHKQAENTRSLIESNKRASAMHKEATLAFKSCERTLAVLAKCETQGIAFDRESLAYLKSDCHGKYSLIHYKYHGW